MLKCIRKTLPTDRQVLRTIYETYYEDFKLFDLHSENNSREAKIYVPIDIKRIAEKLKVDPDIIFGRLYYHINPKYGWTHEDKVKVLPFSLMVGQKDKHCVNFPLVASVLAELEETEDRYVETTFIAVFALAVAFISLMIKKGV